MTQNNNLWSCNEWDPLKEIIIGTAINTNIPHGDLSHHATNYANLSPKEYANMPKGRYPDHVYNEAEEDLDALCNVLSNDFGVKVHRPNLIDFDAKISNGLWETDQYEAYCPRDSVTVIGDKIIEGAMSLRARYHETFLFRDLFMDKMMEGANWLQMPKPRLEDSLFKIQPGRDPSVNNNEPILDPANLIRMGYDILYLISNTGNEMGAKWLQNALGPDFRVHKMHDLYSWAHVDSTIMPLRPGLVILNSSRVDKDKINLLDSCYLHSFFNQNDNNLENNSSDNDNSDDIKPSHIHEYKPVRTDSASESGSAPESDNKSDSSSDSESDSEYLSGIDSESELDLDSIPEVDSRLLEI